MKRAEGSPPRMRGKLLRRVSHKRARGITPAHAGKTFSGDGRRGRYRDHPRACGENFHLPTQLLLIEGSPPRMRGKRHIMDINAEQLRITPAHAGKT